MLTVADARPAFELPSVHAIALVSLTAQAQHALDGVIRFVISDVPFRVGRENRRGLKRLTAPFQRRSRMRWQANDLDLRVGENRFGVSPEHFAIHLSQHGFYLIDRGSICGTLVNGALVGGNRKGGRAPLGAGDIITVGSESSPFLFQFMYRKKQDARMFGHPRPQPGHQAPYTRHHDVPLGPQP